MATPLCGKSGSKTSYSRDEALRAMRHLQHVNALEGEKRPLNVYRCPHCRRWHVGHTSYASKELKG
jgi:hypothetical protein